ncbi:MAG TPA: SDR family oxidoreductase [Polyangiaceae bacterium]|nr:SDR family oxidoreductase [Polyangiaceae bacterium]
MIVVTGSSGKLGRLVLDALLEHTPAERVVAVARNPDKLSDMARRGVVVRQGNYDEPASLATAFQGAQRLLLISASEVGKRVPQHTAAIEAAKRARVSQLAYTSIAHCDSNRMKLAAEHAATEALIRASELPFTLLRNSWYIENYTDNLAPALAHGTFLGSAGDGRISAATRADYARAAATVLTQPGHENKTYELGGDQSFTMTELAAAVSEWAGRSIGYTNLPEAAFAQALTAAGLPGPYAEILADCDVGITRGELEVKSGDLHRLIGRDTTSVKSVLQALPKP